MNVWQVATETARAAADGTNLSERLRSAIRRQVVLATALFVVELHPDRHATSPASSAR